MKCHAGLYLLLAALPVLALASDSDSWLTSSSPEIGHARIIKEIPAGLYFEVPVSLFEVAEIRLEKKWVVPLSNIDLKWFSRGHFSCPSTTVPSLVRAVYSNGGTGGYYLQRTDASLWVAHQSLGVSTGERRSALLVCLDFKPSQVFVTSSGAM